MEKRISMCQNVTMGNIIVVLVGMEVWCSCGSKCRKRSYNKTDHKVRWSSWLIEIIWTAVERASLYVWTACIYLLAVVVNSPLHQESGRPLNLRNRFSSWILSALSLIPPIPKVVLHVKPSMAILGLHVFTHEVFCLLIVLYMSI